MPYDHASLLRQLERAADTAAQRAPKRVPLTTAVADAVPLERHLRVRGCRGCRPRPKRPRGVVVSRPPRPLARCEGGKDARHHGVAVERHVVECWQRKRAIEDADPCARAALRWFTDAGIATFATQVRVCSVAMRFTAYADFLCLDAARERLTLVELKAGRGGFNDLCYEHEDEDSHSAFGTHCSAATRDRLQLWAMAEALRETAGVVVDRAVLVRAQPDHVYVREVAPDAFDARAVAAAFLERSAD